MEQLWDMAMKIWGKFLPFLRPDEELWWLFVLTFPLTIVWMVWGGVGLKKLLNSTGAVVFCGPIALLLLSPALAVGGLLLGLFWKVMGILGLALSLSVWGILEAVFGFIVQFGLFFFIAWAVNKLSFGKAEQLVRGIISWFNEQAKKVWGFRQTIEAKPHWGWQVLGGLFIALLLNGSFAVRLTEKHPGLPGIIPGISAVVGACFFTWRTVLGHKLRERGFASFRRGLTPDGSWLCPEPTNPLTGKPGEGELVRAALLEAGDICATFNPPVKRGKGKDATEHPRGACRKCGTKNPYLPRECCGNEDIAWNERCPDCGKLPTPKEAAHEEAASEDEPEEDEVESVESERAPGKARPSPTVAPPMLVLPDLLLGGAPEATCTKCKAPISPAANVCGKCKAIMRRGKVILVRPW